MYNNIDFCVVSKIMEIVKAVCVGGEGGEWNPSNSPVSDTGTVKPVTTTKS